VTGGDALQASTAVPFDEMAAGFQLSALRSSSAIKVSKLIHHNPDTRFETRIGDDFAALDGHCQVADKPFDLGKRQRGNIGRRKVGWLPVASRKPITRQPVNSSPSASSTRNTG
jgi:hypothetical protein